MLKTSKRDAIGSAASVARGECVLSFSEIINILGISKPTFFRSIKTQLPIVYISKRRQGVRASDLETWLQKKTRKAA
jgi:predicted DNA-binding transcriptional regulator AlpA